MIDIESLRQDRNKVVLTKHVAEAHAKKIHDAVLGQRGQPDLVYRVYSQLNSPYYSKATSRGATEKSLAEMTDQGFAP